MEKWVFAAVSAAALFTFAVAEAQNPGDIVIDEYYTNGTIREMRSDLRKTGCRWTVRNRHHKQVWRTKDACGRDVVVKLKGNDHKTFAKIKVDGGKVFVKDVDPVNRTRHVAKILKNGERYKERNVLRHDGVAVMSNNSKKPFYHRTDAKPFSQNRINRQL